MKWTDETPTEPGLYRHCFQNSTKPEGLEYRVVRLVRSINFGVIYMELFGSAEYPLAPYDYGCWYGPIELPDYG